MRRKKASPGSNCRPASLPHRAAIATTVLVLLTSVFSSVAQAQDSQALLRLETARQLRNGGSALRASKEYEAIVPLFRAGSDLVLYGRVLLEASQIALSVGDYLHAIERATEAAGIYAGQGDRRNEAMAINFVGLAKLYRGEYAAALLSFQRA